MIPEGHKVTFEMLKVAFSRGDVCILQCMDKETGEDVTVICAVNSDGQEYDLVPLAKLFSDNPYDELIPPREDEEMNEGR